MNDNGATYTRQQLTPLSDVFLVTILESDNESELAELSVRLVMLIDPTYKKVFTMVNTASATGGTLDRPMTYDLLVKYFNARKTPITVSISRWTDALLIRTFRTLRLPDANEYIL